jgi:amino acid adenylation domain-containing protein
MTVAPASRGQEQIWLFERAFPETASYHLPEMWELTGPLSPALLEDAIRAVVARHEALRTTVRADEGDLWQHVGDASAFTLARTDARHATEVEVEAAVTSAVRRPFDLATDLPLRGTLLHVAPDRHLLVLVLHHIAGDGYSAAIIRDEIVLAYTAMAENRPVPWPAVGRTFREEASRRRTAEAAGRPTAPIPRWQDAAAPVLPYDHPRPEVASNVGGVVRADIGAGGLEALGTFGLDRGVTPFSILLALFGWLMGRWSGQDRVLVTVPLAGRDDPAVEHTVGFFVRTAPIVLDVSVSFLGDLAVQAQAAVLEALAETSEVAPRLAGHVSFAVEQFDLMEVEFAGVRRRPCPVHTGTSKFDLAARVERTPAGGRIHIEFDARLFAPATAQRIADHFAELVAAAAAPGGDDMRLWPPMPAADRARLAVTQRGARTPVGPLVLDSIAAAVARHGEAVAVFDGIDGLTYSELWRRSGQLGGRLVRAGLGPNALVGVCLPPSPALVVAAVGIMRSGAAFVPLDPRDPPARRVEMLNAALVRVLVADDVDLPGWDGTVLRLADVARQPTGHRLPGDTADPAAVAYLTHTSGSTGAPKAVLTTHRGLANYLNWAVPEYGLGPGTLTPLHTAPAFDLATTALLGPLVGGGTIHALAESATRHERMLSALPGYQMLKATPTHLDLLMASSAPAGRPPVVVLGGENIDRERARRLRRWFPDSRLVNEYGPTETVVGSTRWDFGVGSGEGLGDHVPIGLAIPNTDVHVVDGRLRPVPIGVWGELAIGGVGVSHGYLGASGLTASRFRPDPFSDDGGRLYLTGDVCRWSVDGALEMRGRADGQVKILGYRVELAEVEAAVRGVPGVRQAVVQSDGTPARLTAFVVAEPTELDQRSVVAHLRMTLPAHMVPESVVMLTEMPLSPSGKVDRSALTPPTRGAEPDSWQLNELQQLIHDAWCEVLGVTSVDPHTRFFDAGGTSLMLLRLERELASRGLGMLGLPELFRHPTVHGLARLVQRPPVSPPSVDLGRRAAVLARRDRVRSQRRAD